jgi:NADH:ubiquinone oxidoreductase subunit K
MLPHLALFSVAMFAIGIAGIASNRNLLIMILSIEVSLISATTFVISLYAGGYYGYAVLFIFAVWALAAVEAITLIVLYQELARREMGLDVSKLSKLRD